MKRTGRYLAKLSETSMAQQVIMQITLGAELASNYCQDMTHGRQVLWGLLLAADLALHSRLQHYICLA